MKVLFLGRKSNACIALEYLLKRKVQVVAVVAPIPGVEVQTSPTLYEVASRHKIPCVTDEQIYDAIAAKKGISLPFDPKGIDWIMSFLFWKKIKKPLIELGKKGCLNFHPAPLPEFRGLGGYNIAVFEDLKYWGAAVHYVNEKFDEGDLVRSVRFDIDPKKETALTLERKTQELLLQLFKETADLMIQGKALPREKQQEGRYISRKEMEGLRVIRPEDSLEAVEKKIRAYWYPPYPGATIEIKGKSFTLIDEKILKEIAQFYHKKNTIDSSDSSSDYS